MSGLTQDLTQIKADIVTAQAAADTASIGEGEIYINRTAARALNTVYTNSGVRTKFLNITSNISSSVQMSIFVGGKLVCNNTYNNVSGGVSLCAIVPNGLTYEVRMTIGSVSKWYEAG
jgi:hypothetical protein